MLDAPVDRLPSFWNEMAELGWLGLHVSESHGGQGFALAELAVVLEELGRAVAPGPFLPTTLASALIFEKADETLASALLPRLVDGSTVAAVGLGGDLVLDNDGTLTGSGGLVLSGELAQLFLLPAGDDVVIVDRDQAGLAVDNVLNLDPSRRVTAVRAERVDIPHDRVLSGARPALTRLARALGAAEASGGAHACTEMATEYAKVRKQFGRPIGTFQAVKHHVANMLVAAEQITAGAWGATRGDLSVEEAELAAAVAACLALPNYTFCAEVNIQVHGGIGFTWEHDAHLYLRRATALSALIGPVDQAREEVTQLKGEGIETPLSIALPPEAESIRPRVRAFVETLRSVPDDEKRRTLAESGYLVPHWPKPFGLDAGPIEQLVIEEEFAGVERPNLGITGWNTLTILQHGTPAQVDRYVGASLAGEIEFCQLFSEPGAGSDAAAVSTRGVKVDGGWRVTGQKVWTSGAHLSSRGFATVRTNPSASKHRGITMMIIDMKAPGVEVRPIRQISGFSHFNEVFLEDVFVPDEDVVGPVDDGWAVARTTLGNERVSIGRDGGGGLGRMPNLVKLMNKHCPGDVGVARAVGASLADSESTKLLSLRSVVRAVAGREPGAEGNVTKLLGSEIAQRSMRLAARIGGWRAAGGSPKDARFGLGVLTAPSMTIGGGTSEIARNQIAERILGLPRDPLIK